MYYCTVNVQSSYSVSCCVHGRGVCIFEDCVSQGPVALARFRPDVSKWFNVPGSPSRPLIEQMRQIKFQISFSFPGAALNGSRFCPSIRKMFNSPVWHLKCFFVLYSCQTAARGAIQMWDEMPIQCSQSHLQV